MKHYYSKFLLSVGMIFLGISSYAQYCTTGLYYNGCQFGDMIDNCTIGSIVQVATGCPSGTAGYSDYTGLSTDLEQGSAYTFSMSTQFGGQYATIWIDYNDDEVFDITEQVLTDFYVPYTFVDYSTQFAIPCTATLGTHRMRVRCVWITTGFDACSQYFYGEVHDYTANVLAPSSSMTVLSTTSTQNNLTPVSLGTPDVEILGIEVIIAGCANPFDLTSLTLNSNGTTDFAGDVTNVKVWYTGTSSAFATGTLFGSAATLAAPITGTQSLTTGTNYFWVTYDINPGGTLGNFLDAECTQIDLSGAGGTQFPSVTAPSGNRMINYCIPIYGTPCSSGDYIDNFTFNTLSNLATGCNGQIDNYIYYAPSGSLTTTVILGGTYTITLQAGYTWAQGFGVWIDYNNDGDMADVDEFIYASPTWGTNLFTGSVTIPGDFSYVGDRRLRVRAGYFTNVVDTNWCGYFAFYGETEDYTITIDPPPPCAGTPVAGTASADPTDLCALGGTSNLDLDGYTIATGISIQWEESVDGSVWIPIPGATNDTYVTGALGDTMFYHAIVSCSNSGLSATSNDVEVQVADILITSSAGNTICGQGSADLTAIGNGDLINWYASASGGYPLQSDLGTSSTYTPFVTATTTFYAGAAAGNQNIGHTGAPDNSIGPISSYVTYNYHNFDALAPCTLVSVTVYPAAAGTGTIRLYDGGFNIIQTWIVTFSASDVGNPTVVSMNQPLAVGFNYHLAQDFPAIAMFYNDFGAAYPYTIPGVFSITGNGFGGTVYPFFYDYVIDYSDYCESPLVPVTLTVTPPPVLDIIPNPSNATICANSGTVVNMDATNANYTNYNWAPATGLSSATGPIVDASPATTTTYILTADGLGCTNADTITVNVVAPPTVTATATPDSMCSGLSAQLDAVVVPALNYIAQSTTFAPIAGSGTQIVLPSDDATYGPFDFGFTFNFYGIDYTQFYISTNGFIIVDPNSYFNNGCCTGQLLPEAFVPNGVIAAVWEDFYFPGGGTLEYFTTGVAPNQVLVVNWINVPHFISLDESTFQLQCYETTNCVEVHITNMPGNPNGFWGGHTEGIESADGTLATTVPGRNADATWTAFNDAWQFCPSQYIYDWTPATGLSATNIENPVATVTSTSTYTVTVTDGTTGCSGSDDVTVTILSAPNPGVISASAESVCSSGSVDLTLNGYTAGATIEWQESTTSGGPYTPIAGATNDTYTTPVLTVTTYYVAVVTCYGSATSAEIQIEVLVPPPPPVGVDGEHCGPGAVWLGATGTGTLIWYDAPVNGNYVGSGSPLLTPPLVTTTTYYVQDMIGALPAAPLTTTYVGVNNQNGNMFDITVLNQITINSFDGHTIDTYPASIEIYFKTGTHVGFENNAAAWGAPIGSATSFAANGFGVPTPIPINVNLTLSPGTYSFYITRTDFSLMYYTNGIAVGNIYAQDGNIQIHEGTGNLYPFLTFFQPRIWNGTIHYQSAGCGSTLTAVEAAIFQPDFTVTASDLEICKGDATLLQAINNNGYGSWHFSWDPIIPLMFPPNGQSDSVAIIPTGTTDFTVYIHHDTMFTSCMDTQTVTITVHNNPAVDFTGLVDNQICNTQGLISLTGIPPGGTFAGNGISGSNYDPSIVQPGQTDTIWYYYTDQYGCSGKHGEIVIILNCTGIDDPTLSDALNLFPNPTEGVITLSVLLPGAAENVQLRIFNALGQSVYEEALGSVAGEVTKEFDFTNWAAGSYFIELNVDGAIGMKKFTIQQ